MHLRLLVIGHLNTEVKKAIDIASKQQAKISVTTSIEDALAFLREGKGADLVMIDAEFDIASLNDSMQSEHILTPMIAYGLNCSPKTAVSAIKSGAKEFIPLPPDERLIAAVFTSISVSQKPIIGNSQAFQEVLSVAELVAKTDASILLTGRSGTGKEVFARYIHENSLRSSAPFVKVNCAAIPDNLLESELFGHEKGAFTGAVARRIGKFEESSGGTLLLDEISEMDFRLQAKLLRAIQEHEIDRVGGAQPVRVDLRIIATSNKDLPKAVTNGSFREDLYFRLNVISIELPNLSDRIEDIEPLSLHFVKKYTESNKLTEKILEPEAMKKLKEHSWPGNIRELENVIHRAVLFSRGNYISAQDIHIKREAFVGKKIAEAEQELIINTMDYCLGDLNNAADILGISISSLMKKLENYNLKK